MPKPDLKRETPSSMAETRRCAMDEPVLGGAGHIVPLVEPLVSGLGFELAGVEFVPAGARSVLRVYIDHEDGIDVDDCAAVSHQVSAMLDVEDPIPGQYNLEVSSPGLDRPLCTLAHFERFEGHAVSIELNELVEGRRRLRGTIVSVEDGAVVVDDDQGQYSLPLATIARANLVPEF